MTFPWTKEQWEQWHRAEAERIAAERLAKRTEGRDPSRTTPWQRWSEQELIVIRDFIDSLNGASRPPHGYSHTLVPLLPGRSLQDIRNAYNVMRRKLARICNCGATLAADEAARCATCTQAAKNLRDERLRKALCGTCGDTLNVPGASTTLCPSCRARRQKHRPKDLARFKQKTRTPRSKTDPFACHKIIPWPACGHSRFIAQLVAAEARPVIDLFGGTGELLRLVAVHGGHAHAYFDLDPRIQNLVAHAVQGSPRTPEADTLLHKGNPKKHTLATRLRRLRLLGDTLRPTLQRIECKDALDVLAHPENMPPNAIFLADPPWPGSTQKHPGAAVDHAALIEALLDLPMKQDFVLSLGAERHATELAAKHLCKATLFWRTSGPYAAKSLIALSPGLSALHPELQGIELDKYGC